MIKLGWIDFSNEDREKVMSVLDMMKEKGAVDELGIGIIRDRLADHLFPGSSTIQTRAKYFFIVPWCIMELEKRNIKPNNFKKDLDKLEIEIIYKLLEGGEDLRGIIGQDSKDNLKRKPSSIYWNGLRLYKICPHDVSLSQYIEIFNELKKRQRKIKLKEKKDDDIGDDKDAASLGEINNTWQTVIPRDNWLNELNIKLSKEEGEFLKDI
ncbi:MAG: hypothetical protein K0R54_3585 [Clostridiaceae bacterium]|nr:hypothetical protein [Clostridiaceae bacterium]